MGYTNVIRRISNKITFIILSIIIVALIIDISLIKISRFITVSQSFLGLEIPILIVIVIVYAIGQYIVLMFVKSKIMETRTIEQLHLNLIHKLVSIVQYVLISLLVFLILQMMVTSGYTVSILTVIIGISYTQATITLAFLAHRFFSWFKSNRNFVVMTYGLAIAIISINTGFTLVYVGDVLTTQSDYLRANSSHTNAFFSSNSLLSIGYITSSILSFILTWFATVLILLHYSKKLGRVKYWIIMSIPLAYFLGQFQPLFLDLFATYRLSEPALFGIVYTLIFTASKPAGGVLFGIAFWSVARSIRRSVVRDYMIISAFGFMLLFTSNQATVLITAPYPPFGLATVSFMVLASYLISIGVYSSALSIAQDAKLRQSLRKSVEQQSNLLNNIGTSQMEQEVQKKVVKVMKDLSYQTEEKTGIQTSFEEQDIKEYLNKVIEEVKEKRKQ